MKQTKQSSSPATFISVTGTILGVSYPVLALSTGVRAVYQLFFKEGVTDYVGPSLTAVAALVYILATVGFAYRRQWSWYLSVIALLFEVVLVVIVGGLSVFRPDAFANTSWRYFGIDYAFFPLIQPFLGLVWLSRPGVRQLYGVSITRQNDNSK